MLRPSANKQWASYPLPWWFRDSPQKSSGTLLISVSTKHFNLIFFINQGERLLNADSRFPSGWLDHRDWGTDIEQGRDSTPVLASSLLQLANPGKKNGIKKTRKIVWNSLEEGKFLALFILAIRNLFLKDPRINETNQINKKKEKKKKQEWSGQIYINSDLTLTPEFLMWTTINQISINVAGWIFSHLVHQRNT